MLNLNEGITQAYTNLLKEELEYKYDKRDFDSDTQHKQFIMNILDDIGFEYNKRWRLSKFIDIHESLGSWGLDLSKSQKIKIASKDDQYFKTLDVNDIDGFTYENNQDMSNIRPYVYEDKMKYINNGEILLLTKDFKEAHQWSEKLSSAMFWVNQLSKIRDHIYQGEEDGYITSDEATTLMGAKDNEDDYDSLNTPRIQYDIYTSMLSDADANDISDKAVEYMSKILKF